MNRDRQFELLADARRHILKWAEQRKLPLIRVEYIVPFVEQDFSATIWFFVNTFDDLASLTSATQYLLSSEFSAHLQNFGYDPHSLERFDYAFDSHENVVANFQGSYFYRLR